MEKQNDSGLQNLAAGSQENWTANEKPPRKTKQYLREEVKAKAEEKKLKYKLAMKDFNEGKFDSLRQAAIHYGLNYSTLNHGIYKYGGEFQGVGNFSSHLSAEEEQKVLNHVKWRQQIGYGLDWQNLQQLLQEILTAVTTANPERFTGLEDRVQLPGMSWVCRFAERHNLVPRTTMAISKGRQVITPEELSLWQSDVYSVISSKPELLDALQVGFP